MNTKEQLVASMLAGFFDEPIVVPICVHLAILLCYQHIFLCCQRACWALRADAGLHFRRLDVGGSIWSEHAPVYGIYELFDDATVTDAES